MKMVFSVSSFNNIPFSSHRWYQTSSTSCGYIGSVKSPLPQVRLERVLALPLPLSLRHSSSLPPSSHHSPYPLSSSAFLYLTTCTVRNMVLWLCVSILDVEGHLSIRLDSQSGNNSWSQPPNPNKDLLKQEHASGGSHHCIRSIPHIILWKSHHPLRHTHSLKTTEKISAFFFASVIQPVSVHFTLTSCLTQVPSQHWRWFPPVLFLQYQCTSGGVSLSYSSNAAVFLSWQRQTSHAASVVGVVPQTHD